MAKTMEGRRAVVTGASAGVGRAVAHRLARAGAATALLARDAAALAAVQEEVEALGGRALAIPVDVADAGAVADAADRAAVELGPLSIWINCAMVTVFSPLDEMSADEFRRVTEVTYLGYVHGTMAALCHMRRANDGVILQVGSALAYRGIPLQSAYCGAKHAVRGFTDSLRCELLHQGSAVRVVTVHLPAVNTPQFDWARTHMAHEPRPVGPVVQPKVAAEAIVAALSGSSREIWVGRSTFATIMASMVLPSYLDGYLARNAFDSQATSHPVPQDRPDNLIAPVTNLHRTRGRFDSEAGGRALSLPGSVARFAVIAGGAATIVALGAILGASLFG
jgi:NAD(P)-dependent dehydrogenase (short-subunit alcohol dehydrogenase family)